MSDMYIFFLNVDLTGKIINFDLMLKSAEINSHIDFGSLL